MDEIIIDHINRSETGWTAVVEIGSQSDSSTTHNVSIGLDYYQHLTDGNVDIETLVEESFKFLLEREDPASIMRNFDLDVIGNFFEDYESEINKRIQSYRE